MSELIIDCAAVSDNLELLRRKVGVKLCMMVKADAYGHGLNLVKTISDKVDMFGVASSAEALELLMSGINKPILIAGGYSPEYITECLLSGVHYTVYSAGAIREIDNTASRLNVAANIHLKIDTGMHRLGIREEDLARYLNLIETCKNIKLQAVFTHFATADDDDVYLKQQNDRFKNITYGIGVERHAANSAAALKGEEYRYDMVRCGLAAYGYEPYDNACSGLRSAMSLRAKIIDIKKINRNETVGYSRKYCAQEDILMGVVAAGYGDGIPRALSNCGKIIINGQKCDIIGNICMDLLMVDLGQADAEIGGDAYIISGQNTAAQIAKLINVIPYEIITGITKRPVRIYS